MATSNNSTSVIKEKSGTEISHTNSCVNYVDFTPQQMHFY